MIFFKKKPQIIITKQTYIDGDLKSETASVIESKPGFWFYAVPVLMALVVFHQVVMR